MRTFHFVLGLGVVGVFAVLGAACGSDGSGGGGGGAGGAGNFGGTGATGATGGTGTGGATGGTGGGNTGGVAGQNTGGAAGGGGASGSGGGTSDASTDGGGTVGDHLLISEVGIEPGGAEFIEIWNPTNAEVDLSNYYVADNSAYYKVTSGPWNPQGTPNTDFLARFPAGTKLAAGAVLVVAPENVSGKPTFEATFGKCPDFTLNSTAAALSCASKSVPAMLIPTNGSVGSQVGALISNDREMIVLFSWDGSASTVKDVDYVTWGTQFDANTRVDKTGVSGYQADTAAASQKPANQGVAGDGGASLAIERCKIESGEKTSGGNGISGHDETSEDMGASFKSQSAPSPGTKNSCL
ncbi:MAG: lamin tail domain-containing protein [Myxococcales bacterium]|nr:lamin tail domain-containing protein [Myxococcales bacterium]